MCSAYPDRSLKCDMTYWGQAMTGPGDNFNNLTFQGCFVYHPRRLYTRNMMIVINRCLT